jgi:GNAT superfamily N-acetyltransferase
MRYELSSPGLTFRRMASADRRDVFPIFAELVLRDDYFRDSRGAYVGTQSGRDAAEAALGEALTLFVDRPDYGFIFLALEDEKPVAGAAVSYAISLALGKVVAKLEHLIVTETRRREGIGTELVEALADHLRLIEIARLDVDVHLENKAARQFYLDLDFKPSHEERMALLL